MILDQKPLQQETYREPQILNEIRKENEEKKNMKKNDLSFSFI